MSHKPQHILCMKHFKGIINQLIILIEEQTEPEKQVTIYDKINNKTADKTSKRSNNVTISSIQ